MRLSLLQTNRRLRILRYGVLFIICSVYLAACDFFKTPEDFRAPLTQILRPGDRAQVGSEVSIRVSATVQGSEDNYISFVNVTANGEYLGEALYIEDSDPPIYEYRWDTFTVPDGEYRLEAIAFDRLQARGISNPVVVAVENVSSGEGPATLIAAPRDGDNVTGKVRVIVQRQPGEPDIAYVNILVDGTTVTTLEQAPFEYDWDTSVERYGQHHIRARAYLSPGVFKYSDPVYVNILGGVDPECPDCEEPTAEFQVSGFTGEIKGSVAVGFNNDVYVASLSDTLYAFSPSQRLRWKRGTKGPIRSTPVVGNNEDIFITSEDGRLYGYTSTGDPLWPAYNTGTVLRSTPALGIEGYLYFGDGDGRVHAVNSFNGLSATGWPRKIANAPIVVPPVIGRDQTVVVAATDGFVYALGSDGALLWRSVQNIGSVSVGMALIEREIVITLPNGDVTSTKTTVLYVVSNDGYIYALSGQDGTLLWSYPLTGPLRSGPVVGPDGVIYVGTSTGLIALNEEEDQFTPRLRYIYPAEDVGTPAIDANESIYFVSGTTLIAINPNNTPIWEFPLNGEADGPLTIGRDGLVYVACNNQIMYGVQTGSVGLAQEKWPMFQRNARHSGRLGIDATDG